MTEVWVCAHFAYCVKLLSRDGILDCVLLAGILEFYFGYMQ
jgi:hypothetical protein